MRKILLLDDYFATGEQTVQPVLLYGPGRNRMDLSHVTKTASDALEYIKHVVPEPGKTQALLLALGAEETYGPNRNGDGFPERPVRSRQGQGFYVSPGQELTKHYQTFETNPAHAFKHHQNKDPAKASGVVKKAFWNPKMHRVELLISIDNDKDPEWVQRLNDGDFPPVSMGCRIKYDVCNRCGNQAPTRAQYCDHVKFAMNEVGPDGIKNYVHNPSPNFFDISRVVRPADRTGYTLKKVASVYEIRSSAALGEMADDIERKSAAIRKLSDIDKIIRGEPIASASNLAPHEQTLIRNFRNYTAPRLGDSPDLPMEELHKHSAAAVLSTCSALGIMLKDAEFVDFMATKLAGKRLNLPATVFKKVSALVPQVFGLFEESPALFDHVLETGVLDEHPEKLSSTLVRTLLPYVEKRAGAGEMLYRRLVPEGIGLRPDEAPRTDLLTYTDPSTGATHETTRGAAIDAEDAVTRAHLGKILGGSALLLGGYKALSAMPSLRNLKLPLGIGAAALGYHTLKDRPGHDVSTNEGFAIPNITEFAPQTKTSAENIPGFAVNLLEEYRKIGYRNATKSALLHAVKSASAIDEIRGVEFEFESVANILGSLILSRQ